MKPGEAVFVDSGAWIALAVAGDPYHVRAREHWEILARSEARLFISIPVGIETFTFLDRNSGRADALRWRSAVATVRGLQWLTLSQAELEPVWLELERRSAQRLSLVDASSFVLMRGHRIRRAFSFDYHFAAAGFLPID